MNTEFSRWDYQQLESLLKDNRAFNDDDLLALARAMGEIDRLTPRWTTDRPTERGDYWYRADSNEPETIVHVYEMANGLGVYKKGIFQAVPEGQWAGPIPQPIEGQEQESTP